MKIIALMMNNYFHDFATALLFANIVLFFALIHSLKGRLQLNQEQLAAVFSFIKRVNYICFTWIIIGGAIRTYNYKTFEWVEAAGKGQVAALGVKHVVLVGVVVAGLAMQFKYARRFRNANKNGDNL